jgi:hypothetical protein
MMRSFFDGKFRYSVILAVPAWAMIASTPTARTPSLLNNSYAARPTRSRPVSRGAGESEAGSGWSDIVMAALGRLPPRSIRSARPGLPGRDGDGPGILAPVQIIV